MPFTFNDVDDVLETYGLPPLPEPDDDAEYEDTVTLVLFRHKDENIPLGDSFTLADAQEYCSRDDTADNSVATLRPWFTGFWRH
jgi:hypothetical protein